MDISSELSNLLNAIIRVMIIPILPALTTFIILLIKKRTVEIENQLRNNELAKYLKMAENAVITAVTAVNQIYVSNLKKENGKLSSHEQKAAFEMARERTLKILGDPALKILREFYKDFDIWLENQIEFYVNQLKTNPDSVRKVDVI